MDITLSQYVIGLVSSIVAELFKLFPALRKNDLTIALTAIVVLFLGELYEAGFKLADWSWSSFASLAVFAFLNYKFIVQPIASVMKSDSQS